MQSSSSPSPSLSLCPADLLTVSAPSTKPDETVTTDAVGKEETNQQATTVATATADSLVSKPENDQAETIIKELRDQLKVAKRRENLAVLRLAVKEKQLHEILAENDWMCCGDKNDKNGAENKADSSLMDHTVGALFTAMRSEFRVSRKELKSAKLELRTLKAQTGNAERKKLIAKCRNLEQQLNEAKQLTHRLARLETLLAYSQKTVDSLRRKQRDLDDIMAEHDEEMSRIQAQLMALREENDRLREQAAAAVSHNANQQDSNVDAAPQSDSHNAQPCSTTPDQTEHDAGELDTAEDKATEEMVMVSSPEVDVELNDGQRSAKRMKLDNSEMSTECNEEVIAVSSPEHDCEPDDVIVVSSPETETIQHATISDDSD